MEHQYSLMRSWSRPELRSVCCFQNLLAHIISRQLFGCICLPLASEFGTILCLVPLRRLVVFHLCLESVEFCETPLSSTDVTIRVGVLMTSAAPFLSLL